MADKTITKEKIAERIKTELGYSNLICEEIVNSFFDNIYKITAKKSKLTLKNFGKFYINDKKSRPGQNIKTGETVHIPGRKVLRFVPAKNLKNNL